MKLLLLQSMRIKMSFVGLLFVSVLLLIPQLTLAAITSIISDTETISVGDTAIVNVVLDTQGSKPNTIEGDIEIMSGAKNITISEFSLAGSALKFWPKTPSLDSATKISFIGGTPGGLKAKEALVFKIVFTANAEGPVVFSPMNLKLYDNDGKATLLESSSKPLTVTINPKGADARNYWLDILTADKQPPYDIQVSFGQNSSVYGGQKFMTISATDDESGINYYEVVEGDRPAVRSGNTYVLIDQREKTVLTVIAYDKAGNSSKILVTPTDTKPGSNWWGIIAIVVILFGGAYGLLWLKKKRHSSKKIGF